MDPKDRKELEEVFNLFEQICTVESENDELLDHLLTGIQEFTTGLSKTLASAEYREKIKLAIRTTGPMLAATVKGVRGIIDMLDAIDTYTFNNEDKVGEAFEALKFTENSSSINFAACETALKAAGDLLEEKAKAAESSAEDLLD